MDSTDATVGANVRRRRVELGLSAHALGVAVGVSQHDIEQLEAGQVRPGAPLLFRIAAALQCKMSDFFVTDRPETDSH